MQVFKDFDKKYIEYQSEFALRHQLSVDKSFDKIHHNRRDLKGRAFKIIRMESPNAGQTHCICDENDTKCPLHPKDLGAEINQAIAFQRQGASSSSTPDKVMFSYIDNILGDNINEDESSENKSEDPLEEPAIIPPAASQHAIRSAQLEGDIEEMKKDLSQENLQVVEILSKIMDKQLIDNHLNLQDELRSFINQIHKMHGGLHQAIVSSVKSLIEEGMSNVDTLLSDNQITTQDIRDQLKNEIMQYSRIITEVKRHLEEIKTFHKILEDKTTGFTLDSDDDSVSQISNADHNTEDIQSSSSKSDTAVIKELLKEIAVEAKITKKEIILLLSKLYSTGLGWPYFKKDFAKLGLLENRSLLQGVEYISKKKYPESKRFIIKWLSTKSDKEIAPTTISDKKPILGKSIRFEK